MGLPYSLHAVVIAVAFMLGPVNRTPAEVVPIATSARVRPNVVMAADPQPPFTYWAPESSTIRNHPRQPGIWIAESEDGSRKYYFGDQCHASEFQHFVGKAVDVLPEKPANAVWRLACSTCAGTSDLGWTRMNISYDQKTRTIDDISCG